MIRVIGNNTYLNWLWPLYFYIQSAGQYLGEVTEDGDINVKTAHVANLGSTAATSFRTHQVKEGDSLRTLSTQYYGNADYWYIIADANGLTSDVNDPLVVGQTLEIPHQANTANSFDSFTAYNIAEQIGDTQPSLPYVPVPQEADCNVIAT